MAKLFICFAQQDKEFAARLQARFEDGHGEVSGTTSQAMTVGSADVEKEIEAADAFILIVSPSVRSDVWNHEIAHASELGKQLIAITRSDAKNIPGIFDQRNCVSFHEETDEKFAESFDRLLDVLDPPPMNFESVYSGELQYIRARRGTDADVRETLIGLALSGGGIRSATTNLGILQGLSRMRILPMVDYLNTVSGGGYIGSCLSALLSLNKQAHDDPDAARRTDFTSGKPLFTTEWENFPFRADKTQPQGGPSGDTEPGGLTGKAQVKHLRTHGNFVMARQGLFARETMRGIGSLLTGVVYHLAIVLLAIFLVSMLYMGTAQWLVPPPGLNAAMNFVPKGNGEGVGKVPAAGSELTVIEIEKKTLRNGETSNLFERSTEVTGPTLSYHLGQKGRVFRDSLSGLFGIEARGEPLLYGLGLGLVIALLGFAWLCRAFVVSFKEGSSPKKGESQEDAFERRVLWWLFSGTILAVGSVVAWIRWSNGHQEDGVLWLFLPFTVFLGARAGTIALHMIPRWAPSLWKRQFRSLLGSFQALMTYGVLLSLGFAVLPMVIYALAEHGPAASVAEAVGAALSLVATRLLATRAPGTGQGPVAGFKAGLLNFALALTVALFALCIVLLFSSLVLTHGLNPWWALLVVTLVFGGMGCAVNFNKLALHYFYRDRLIETYLRTEVDNGHGRMVERHNATEMPLSQLHGTRPGSSIWGSTAPYHLVTTAINLAGSRDLTRKDRKSGYFLFSKLFCGSPQTGYRRTSKYRDNETKLARAMTISGAAVSSGMGYHTFFAQAFATTLFNLRLGYWLENPNRPSCLEKKETMTFWPLWLIKEMFTATRASDRLVNLSDGGHTGDNVGIYPLLQRRCKIIFACDAEADPNLRFGSFTEALRHAYIDEGIDVDIDLRMLRPDPQTGHSQKHCAIGRIRYPDREDQASWLVYLKSSLSGDEPEPVLNYAREHASFPHETTADLFFDDAQFESYRALGVHMVESTFGTWMSPEILAKLQGSHYPEKFRRTAPPQGKLLDEREVWRRLQFLHSPFQAVDSQEFREMTDALIELERLFLNDPELKEYYAQCYHERPLPPDFQESRVLTKLDQICMIQTQLMEQVFFALRLDRYANAPDNGGWMNLFRRWGRSQLFKDRFEQIKDTFSVDFVDFYVNFVKNCPAIEARPVPHPWDTKDGKGIFLDPGRVNVPRSRFEADENMESSSDSVR